MIDKNLISLLETTPETLAEKQYNALRTYAISVLQDIIKDISEEKYQESKLSYSPAGDGMGCDNYYIPFYLDENENEPADIQAVFAKLRQLKQLKDGAKDQYDQRRYH